MQDSVGALYYVFLTDKDNHLIGVVPLKRLLLASSPNDSLKQYCYPKLVYVRAKDSVREVAYLMEKYKLPSIPVVNNGKEKILQGVITVDDILQRLIPMAWRRRAKKATY